MNSEPNSKIVGAIVVGFALVAGAYTLNSFNRAPLEPIAQQAGVGNSETTLRVAIPVVDADGNGIEDWRDDFVTTEPIVLDEPDENYELPTTLTGQLGINFTQDIIRARGYGAFGRSDDEVIADTIETLRRETAHDIYDTPDIQIIQNWTEEDIKNYANAAALAITRNNVGEIENELFILRDILNRQDESRLEELQTLAEVYRKTRDDTLAIPVPALFVKQHLDLINTYHAVYNDIEGMTLSFEDPAYALLRLKRYEEDALGLYYALQNMYQSLEPYAQLFTADDPAVLFILFSPNNQI